MTLTIYAYKKGEKTIHTNATAESAKDIEILINALNTYESRAKRVIEK